jgi:hypothetical protein
MRIKFQDQVLADLSFLFFFAVFFFFLNILLLFIYSHVRTLFGSFLPLVPLPSSLPPSHPPHFLAEPGSALIFNFVEEKT